MTASIVLYKDCQLLIDKNFSVDDIEDYLTTLAHSNTLTINYFKHDLEANLLLDLGQASLDISAVNYNYCKITNDSETTYYYFINDKKWRSKEVVALSLYMDTISTLGWLDLTNKTLIHRQHMDRWVWKGLNTKAFPVIHKTDEGINPLLRKTNEIEIREPEASAGLNIPFENRKWYIGYFNNDAIIPTDYNQVNPVTMIMFPEGSGYSVYINNSATITLTDGEEMIFAPSSLPDGSGNNFVNYNVKFSSQYNVKVEMYNSTDEGEIIVKSVKIKANTSTLDYTIIYSRYSPDLAYIGSYSSATVSLNTLSFTIENAPATVYSYTCSNNNILYNAVLYSDYDVATGSALKGLDDLDRTDSRIIKVIEFPYCPLTLLTTDNGSFIFRDNIEIKTVLGGGFSGIALRENGSYFKQLKTLIEYNITPYPIAPLVFANTSKVTNKNKNYEPKLKHSSLYSFKIVYDSFNSIIKLEDITYDQLTNFSNFKFYFIPSLNIQSDFIIDYSTTFNGTTNEDYSNMLYSKRNNEVAIYSSQYINYLRNGYNFDVKVSNARERLIAVNGIGQGGSAALNTIEGVAAFNTNQIWSGASRVVSGLANWELTSLQNAMQVERQLAQSQAQANSVQGANDLSLLNYYTKNNKAKFVYYTPSTSMENNLFNLFYYMGYRIEQMGTPALTGRIRFNFIQAEIDLDVAQNSDVLRNIPENMIKDYKARFAIGLTIFHKYSGVYDFEQLLENWETGIINYLS